MFFLQFFVGVGDKVINGHEDNLKTEEDLENTDTLKMTEIPKLKTISTRATKVE